MRNTNGVQCVRLAASRVHRTVGSVSTLGLLLDISVGQAMSCNNSCQGNDVNFVAEPRVVDHMARDLNPRRVHTDKEPRMGGFNCIPLWLACHTAL
ncbi:hypothetical protein M441DRAFT_60645 [Trichoderma asperellum CBS 433.97]|uniref:Uncharacterized protein n=1 Tax=Trichoderma asperellum (strain ATCC 204424 / CBS 433.97 / NBRC 101777) TaxID=1042311 RepID=A0A2T3Z0S4_TRIA4|nr:hypothetical protein M441DRAFT_60645 [Trichoderma asperellum CBS 433.97]PTB38422.1 hypothetical protein M441DRAFT_60645 [Trichoderma asperellum CBS 433.97]